MSEAVSIEKKRERSLQEAFEPARDLLLVEKIEGTAGKEEKSAGGLFLPATYNNNFAHYRVISVGPLFAPKSGVTLKRGDVVLAHHSTGHPLFGAILMSINDVYGVIARAT